MGHATVGRTAPEVEEESGQHQDGEQQRAHELAGRLAQEFDGVPADLVEQRVAAAFGRFADASIRDYVGVFVERTVRTELRARIADGVSRAV